MSCHMNGSSHVPGSYLCQGVLLIAAQLMASCARNAPTSSAEPSPDASLLQPTAAQVASESSSRPSFSSWSPSAFSILLVAGESEQQGSPIEGMVTAKT